jgi:hypothetical protein
VGIQFIFNFFWNGFEKKQKNLFWGASIHGSRVVIMWNTGMATKRFGRAGDVIVDEWINLICRKHG